MNQTQTTVRHPEPPRLARVLINALVSIVLRSPWHRLMSPRLLLLTFTGRKSGKTFTTPIRYAQQGQTLQLKVLVKYSWWKNLPEQPAVHILLRGKIHTGRAEVLPEEAGVVVVNIHLSN